MCLQKLPSALRSAGSLYFPVAAEWAVLQPPGEWLGEGHPLPTADREDHECFSRSHTRVSLSSDSACMAGRQFRVLPVSEAAVRRPFQAWHNVHAHGQCPFREPEGFRIVFESCIISLGRDSHRHPCLKEHWHAWLEISCLELLRPRAPAGGALGCAPESLERQKIYHIGGCTVFPSGAGQDFHRKSM